MQNKVRLGLKCLVNTDPEDEIVTRQRDELTGTNHVVNRSHVLQKRFVSLDQSEENNQLKLTIA